MSEEMKLEFCKAAISTLHPSHSSYFFNEVLKNKIIELQMSNDNLLENLLKALEESTKQKNNKRVLETPGNYFQFLMVQDEQFQETIHITRNTAKILIERMRGISADQDNNHSGPSKSNEPIDKMLFLLLWYLSNEDKQMEDAVGMFELGNIEKAYELLNQGIAYVLKLKADAGMLWPTAEEFSHSATSIERRFSFPNVAAVLGHRIINCKNGLRMMLQTLCNEKHMFIDACASFDTRPRVIFLQSSLKERIRDLNIGFVIISEHFKVPQKYKKNVIVPYKEGPDQTSNEKQLYNIVHEFVLGILTETFDYLLSRFPRLKLLDRCETDVVLAACILHNYCIKLSDTTPL